MRSWRSTGKALQVARVALSLPCAIADLHLRPCLAHCLTLQVAVVLEGRGSGASPEGPEPLHLRMASQDPHNLLEAVK